MDNFCYRIKSINSCSYLEMKSFYLSCFMLALLLAACTSSPFVNLDEDDLDSELNDEVTAVMIYKTIICIRYSESRVEHTSF